MYGYAYVRIRACAKITIKNRDFHYPEGLLTIYGTVCHRVTPGQGFLRVLLWVKKGGESVVRVIILVLYRLFGRIIIFRQKTYYHKGNSKLCFGTPEINSGTRKQQVHACRRGLAIFPPKSVNNMRTEQKNSDIIKIPNQIMVIIASNS